MNEAQRSGYCVYSVNVRDGKRYGQPRSLLDTDGKLTNSAMSEAQRISGRKDLSSKEVIRVLQKALRDGTLATGPGGKKCAVRGDEDFVDLMLM
jgi:hypothetical protein